MVFGCQKYEEGPQISLRTVEKRIYGTYRIEYFAKNGNNLTSYWNQYYDLSFKIEEISPADISDHIGIKVEGFIDSCGVMKSIHFPFYSLHYWVRGDDEMIMLNNYLYDPSLYPDRLLYPLIVSSGTMPVDSFHITKLTMDELWLRHTNNTDIYEIHFKE